jgi:hypothetical protein
MIVNKETFVKININFEKEEAELLAHTLRKINGLLKNYDLEDNEQILIDEIIHNLEKQ